MLWHVMEEAFVARAWYAITLIHGHTIFPVYRSKGGVLFTNNGSNKRLWLPVAMILQTSD